MYQASSVYINEHISEIYTFYHSFIRSAAGTLASLLFLEHNKHIPVALAISSVLKWVFIRSPYGSFPYFILGSAQIARPQKSLL